MKIGLKVALSVAAFAMACGGTTDPSDKNGSANGDPNADPNANTNIQPNGDPNANTNIQPNGDPNANTNVQPNGDPNANTNINPNGDPNANTNIDPGPCTLDTNFYGQITSTSDEHAGGAPTTDPFATDAGLAGAMGQFMAMEDMEQVVDIDISGATVTATNFGGGGNTNFWVQDSGAAMQLFLGFDNPVPVDVKVGDQVSFKITSFNNFSGHPQIASVEGFVVDSSGNEVSYLERTGMAVTADDYAKLVRVAGVLGDTSEGCGGDYVCYTLTHGEAGSEQTIIYRTNSDFIEPGQCVQYFGPLGGFPGPNADSGNAPDWQLSVINFSWSFGI